MQVFPTEAGRFLLSRIDVVGLNGRFRLRKGMLLCSVGQANLHDFTEQRHPLVKRLAFSSGTGTLCQPDEMTAGAFAFVRPSGRQP